MDFITPEFNNEIKERVIKMIFQNLKNEHMQLLHSYLINLMNIVSIKFCFDKKKQLLYETQWRLHSYRDVRALLNIILPYIDDPTDSKKKMIRSFDELYIKKAQNVDINAHAPKYTYTNLQYGRSLRDDKYKELAFSPEHLRDNYVLFLDTIQIVSNKLFTNWMNIMPLDLNTYKNTTLYQLTKKQFDDNTINYWDVLDNNSTEMNLSTMYFGDIYNTLTNHIYIDIQRYKWILFELTIGAYLIPYGIALGTILPGTNYYSNKQWEETSFYDKNVFSKMCDKIKRNAEQGEPIGSINGTMLRRIIVDFTYNFDAQYYMRSIALSDGYIQIPSNLVEDDENQDTFSKIFVSFKSITSRHFYEHVRYSYQIINKSWFVRFFYNKDAKLLTTNEYRGVLIDYNLSLNNDSTIMITPKNMYNFCKSLCHIPVGNKYILIGNNWRNIDDKHKNEIIERLKITPGSLTGSKMDLMDWFNISMYYKRVYSSTGIQEFHRIVYKILRSNLVDLVFEILITRGVLTTFNPEPSISGNVDYGTIIRKVQDRLKDKTYMKQNHGESYYFINNIRYFDIPELMQKDREQGSKMMNYFDIISTDQSWYTMYALDWISQLSFFHRYLNNRILYVTGATGVGKSTQIPKLLLYALKMIDYNNDGKIVCSQPRIPPTQSNASRIALELGLPITEYKKDADLDISTNNFYVQYQHSVGQHTKDSVGLSLKIVTDGILNATLLKNKMLKRSVVEDGVIKYKQANEYDIVIVDEAHEHNPNMDFILTLMRNTLYLNNSIKLIIISATMDDDEPIYRRYYRDINDNIMYPSNITLEKGGLDRINVDRRLHISPPGMTTRNKVVEHIDKRSPVDVTLDIIKKSTDGDILVFQIGTKEIRDFIREITPNLPYNVIALPYHGKMSQRHKDFIEQIDKKLHDLVIPKDKDFESIKDFDNIDGAVQKGTYQRAVIVATNIAEASITITTLKYVVDNGKQKIGRYDYKIRNTVFDIIDISESSRIQRKGRVGRVSSGEVYYTYDIENRNSTNVYNISISDISENLFHLLNNSDSQFIFDKDYDPNISINLVMNELNKKYTNGIGKIIVDQYFRHGKQITYRGNAKHYDYHNTISYNMNDSGYTYQQLNDHDGNLHIIHPDEMYIKRNIGGIITGIDPNQNDIYQNGDKFISNKINSFWDLLAEYVFIVQSSPDTIYKTQFGNNVMDLKEQITNVGRIGDLSIRDIIVYLYSRQYKCDIDIISIVSMMNIMSKVNDIGTSSREYVKGEMKMKSNMPLIQSIYGKYEGDLLAIRDIVNKILSYLIENTSCIAIDINNITEFTKLITIEKVKYLHGDIGNKYMYTYFDRICKMGLISNDNVIDQGELEVLLSKDIIVELYKDILEQNKLKLYEHFTDMKLNPDFIYKAIINYVRIKNNIFKYEIGFKINENGKKKLMIDQLELIDKALDKFHIFSKSHDHNIIQSFLFGYSYNIAKRIGATNYYFMLQNPDLGYILKLQTINPYIDIVDSFSKNAQYEYIIFISNNDRTISLIQKINLFDYTLPHIYTPGMFKAYDTMVKYNISYLTNILSSLSPKPQNTVSLITLYEKDTQTAKIDGINAYDDNIWYPMSFIDDTKDYRDNITKKRLSFMLRPQQQTGGSERMIINDFIGYVIKHEIN